MGGKRNVFLVSQGNAETCSRLRFLLGEQSLMRNSSVGKVVSLFSGVLSKIYEDLMIL